MSRPVATQLRRDVLGHTSFSYFAGGLHEIAADLHLRKEIGYYDMLIQQKKQPPVHPR